jgi:hypothetical protein
MVGARVEEEKRQREGGGGRERDGLSPISAVLVCMMEPTAKHPRIRCSGVSGRSTG